MPSVARIYFGSMTNRSASGGIAPINNIQGGNVSASNNSAGNALESSSVNGNGNANGRPSRFAGDFDPNDRVFQTGVDQRIWTFGQNTSALGTRPSSSWGAGSANEGSSSQERVETSSAFLTNGSGSFNQMPNVAASPFAHRPVLAARPFVNTAQPDSFSTSENGNKSSNSGIARPLDPSATLFSSRNSAESLSGLTNTTSSRGSSQHGMSQQSEAVRSHPFSQSPIDLSGWSPRSRVDERSRVQRGSDSVMPSVWDMRAEGGTHTASRNNSQAVSGTNSQAASRNNSVPPSRNGMESSPTENSFPSPVFYEQRARPFMNSDKPTSQGHYTATPFANIAPGTSRRQSVTSGLGSVSDARFVHGNALSSRTTINSSSSRTGDHLNIAGLNDTLRGLVMGNTFSMIHTDPDQQIYSNDEDGFPVLRNEVPRAPQSLVNTRSNNAGYLDQVRHGRGYGQNFSTPMFSHQSQNYAPSGPWPYSTQLTQALAQTQTQAQAEAQLHAQTQTQTQAGMGRSTGFYEMQPNAQPEFYDAQLMPDPQQGFPGSHGARHVTHSSYGHRPSRSHALGRNQLAVPSNQGILASGNHWRERNRPGSSQTTIEIDSECRLKDIVDDVARFAGDQHGSRFIQEKLDTANSEEKDAVFQEMLPNTIPLCVDPFGNYVIQKFFERGTLRQKKQLADQMRGKVKDLSMNTYGCRCIQKAFDHVLVEQQVTLVKELRSCLFEVSKDQHGNHVVQKVIGRLPASDIQFIIHGYYDRVHEMSIDAYGCRVIQRLLEFRDDAARDRLIGEIHRGALSMVKNPFGNYVVQHIIERGRSQDRNRLIDIITPSVAELASNKFASNVVEKCLRNGTEEQRTALVARIAELDPFTGQSKHLKSVIQSNFGNYVVQRILKTLPPGAWEQFADLVRKELNDLVREQRDSDRTPDKKVTEIQKQLAMGPQDPDAPGSPDPDNGGRESRPSTSAGTHVPSVVRQSMYNTGEDNVIETSVTPPLLTGAEASPQSSSAPSTSDSQADESVGPVMIQHPKAEAGAETEANSAPLEQTL